MNKLIAIITILLISVATSAQTPFKGADYMFYYQVNVGKTNGSLTTPSAWLEVGKDSTNKGIRIARVVDTANVIAPVFGLQVYQIKDNKMYYRDKFGWRRFADNTILGDYVQKSDSGIYYYPYWSNPRNFISTELDPVANAKTVRWLAGEGIDISNSAAQPLSSNPVATISALTTTALWNANALQGTPIEGIVPTVGQFLSFNGTHYVPTSPPITGTVNSVGLALPSSVFDITGSPVTNTGTLTGSFKNQLANLVFASPNGVSGLPSFRSLAYSDLPLSGVAAGTYGNDTTIPRITVNSNGIITNAVNQSVAVQWSAVRYKPNNGDFVYSQILSSQSSPGFWISGSGRVDGNTFRVSNSSNNANYGSLEASTVDVVVKSNNSTTNIRRPLTFEGSKYTFQDIADAYSPLVIENDQVAIDSQITRTTIGYTAATNPAPLDSVKLFVKGDIVAKARSYTTGGYTPVVRNNTTGRFETTSIGGAGTVTSVALSAPVEFSVSGSPVTTSGTITISKANQSANTVYAGPASGSAAAPTFRALVVNDLPKGFNITNISDANYSISATDDFIIFSNVITANRTITLPTAATNTGRVLHLITLEMNATFFYSTSPSILLNSGTIITGLGNNSASTIYSDGVNWRLLHESTN